MFFLLLYFQITDQNTTMPAMPTEKSSILAENNYSDLRMKDTLGTKREMDSSTTGQTTTTATTRLTHNPNCKTDNKAADSETTATTTPTQNTTSKSNKIRGVNDFRFGISIGEGSFSTVYLAKDIHTNREYASKYRFYMPKLIITTVGHRPLTLNYGYNLFVLNFISQIPFH